MQLSSPALTLPPFLPQPMPTRRACAPFIALLPDGTVVTGENFAIRIGDMRIVVPAGVMDEGPRPAAASLHTALLVG